MEKQLSLKLLKATRDAINQTIDFSSFYDDKLPKAYIIAHGVDIETRKPITVISRLPLTNTQSNTNWSYHLVMGKVIKE
jgi:hypothetical protein